jgi:DNA mismatch repair protein MutS2
MNDHTFRVLEYDKVKNIVSGYSVSEAGRLLVFRSIPGSNPEEVERRLEETREFTSMLQGGEHPPFDNIRNIGHLVEKVRVAGAMLTPAELLDMAVTLTTGRRVRSFFQKFGGKASEGRLFTPLLCRIVEAIRPLKGIEDAVFAAIDDRAEIKDSASPTLRRIRRQISKMREDILSRMSHILQDSGFQHVIQEPVITIRDERYVLPLKPNFRQSLQGVVHGQSGSRATLFVEPLDVLEQNNLLAELRIEEREEAERILRELTSLLNDEAGSIDETVRALAAIDAVSARARFGIDYNASVPKVTTRQGIRLRAARHPLLVDKQKTQGGAAAVTSNDIVIDGDHRALIISGPNAGGKTVVLKTVGLLCLMAQSGFPIPASDGSELPCFRSIFADIGDEQSLEQDLSTFSSHVSQLADILQRADDHSLVLLDELGSGTEPGEAAGLGAAVLESLIQRGCVTVVTTHHNALKLFGAETSGAVNAAMEFDPQTLKPTYRLIPGRPGRSYGLDMASRLGIPAAVIGSARSRIGQDDVRLEKLLEQMEADSRVLARDRSRLQQQVQAAEQDRKAAEAALQAARAEAREVKAKARSEARETVAHLRQKLHELTRQALIEQADTKRATAEINALSSKLEPEPITPRAVVRVDDLKPGDMVKIERLNRAGMVLASHRERVELDVAGKKVVLSPDELAPLAHQGKQAPLGASGWSAELRDEEASADRINIVGRRVPEGLAELERFIDRAVIHHLSVLTVIHGLGTGALKAAVADFLRNHPLVASIRQGEPAEGGPGVTIAELKR